MTYCFYIATVSVCVQVMHIINMHYRVRNAVDGLYGQTNPEESHPKGHLTPYGNLMCLCIKAKSLWIDSDIQYQMCVCVRVCARVCVCVSACLCVCVCVCVRCKIKPVI